MPEDLKAGPTCVSAPEFLAALERSGVLPDAKWREVQDRFARPDGSVDDSLALAHQLVEDGTLTEFQARRLLRGKKSLALRPLCLARPHRPGGAGPGLQGAAPPDGSRGRPQGVRAQRRVQRVSRSPGSSAR